ncbi:hypothetical protein DFQ01_103190 [Paenibacillus cellulosilyticus]|uniref:Uncharacterized protein n=1 Tax=Paenibacillus cellulosilyticus TaxID=375489 RepID=A0A2V2YWU9_9BACL|nr:hypothetical protein [Paenibacillus cellulosilyticus]PWW06288.1 hypothetical protein DFQ01_103190 [Paenibacillus cellulosilyticus]QKS42963.1 hypothetical protein HUB94_00235 [Paenibacillus cellulosilyticus]QKS43487.1 hypothetical protein HUB94_02905 [Paenibacillus cellulosilyticus]
MSISKKELQDRIIALLAESGLTFLEARKTLSETAQKLETLAMHQQMGYQEAN